MRVTHIDNTNLATSRQYLGISNYSTHTELLPTQRIDTSRD